MKTTIQASGGNRVTISYDDCDTGERVTREFSAPIARVGYVREGNGQVCDRLQTTGNTLMASDESLLGVIRREYRAMRRAEKALGAPRY